MNTHCQQVKTIGANGQLSLGKEFAGKMVLIDQVEKGTWIIRSGEFIPDSEKWLYKANSMVKIDKALAWADQNKPSSNFDAIIQRMENDINKD